MEEQNSQEQSASGTSTSETPLASPSITPEGASEQAQTHIQTAVEPAKKRGKDIDSRIAGICFLVLGAAIFVAQYYGFRLDHYIWPVFILIPGILLFVVSMKVEGGLGESFAIVGSIITMLGLMFFAMNITDMWASWAYAWALLFPTSIGIGQIFYGRYNDQPSLIKTGWNLVKVGVAIFLFGFLFFEGILNISNMHFGMFGLPLFFIAVGVFLLLRTMRKK